MHTALFGSFTESIEPDLKLSKIETDNQISSSVNKSWASTPRGP